MLCNVISHTKFNINISRRGPLFGIKKQLVLVPGLELYPSAKSFFNAFLLCGTLRGRDQKIIYKSLLK